MMSNICWLNFFCVFLLGVGVMFGGREHNLLSAYWFIMNELNFPALIL
jgi:hypothetical protein